MLAEKLNYEHIDTDGKIEAGVGKSVAEIFASCGERKFREFERQVLLSLIACDDVVISCGGGAALCPDFEKLASGSTVVWLTAAATTVKSRLSGGRPLFDGKTVCEIERLISVRSPYYAKYADFAVATDGLTSRQVADIIFDKLSNTLTFK